MLSPAQRQLAAALLRFAQEELGDPDLARRDRDSTFWWGGWRRCADRGLCGLPAPPAVGGAGADRVTTAAALEALGYGCPDAGLAFSLSAHLWSAVVPLTRYGTSGQQARWLPGLCGGEHIGLHAMTEPGSGSDAYALQTTATPEGAGWRLTGRKTLVTNAPTATLLVVFARAPGSTGPRGISAFVVDGAAEGVERTGPVAKLGMRTSPLGDVSFEGVRVGRDALLGTEGHGSRVFSTSMQWERCLIMAPQLGMLRR